MKKALIIAALVLFATPALAFNWKFWSSNHNSRHHAVQQSITRPEPGPPVVNVPEPASGILLATGILALVIGGAVEGRR